MEKLINKYHGSSLIVDTPAFGLDRKNNNFSLEYYSAESNELVKEWMFSSLWDGFSNR